MNRAPAALHPQVHAVGATRRLRALVAIGYEPGVIAAEVGAAERTIWWVIIEPPRRVPAVLDQRVRDVYSKLSSRPLEGDPEGDARQRSADRCRALATRYGWRNPMRWQHIDADPEPAPSRKPSRDELAAKLEDLRRDMDRHIADAVEAQIDSARSEAQVNLEAQLEAARRDLAAAQAQVAAAETANAEAKERHQSDIRGLERRCRTAEAATRDAERRAAAAAEDAAKALARAAREVAPESTPAATATPAANPAPTAPDALGKRTEPSTERHPLLGRTVVGARGGRTVRGRVVEVREQDGCMIVRRERSSSAADVEMLLGAWDITVEPERPGTVTRARTQRARGTATTQRRGRPRVTAATTIGEAA